MIAAFLLVFAALAVYGLSQVAQSPSGPSAPPLPVVAKAGDFTLPVVTENGLSDQMVSLSSFRGKVVVLEFMVSWCTSCQAMAPTIGALHGAYSDENVIFISVAGTFRGADAESTAKFIRDYGTSWTHVLDSSNALFNSYQVKGTPTYFIIDGNGNIRSIHNGAVSYGTLASDIEKLTLEQ